MKRILSLGLIFILVLTLALSLGAGSVVLAEGDVPSDPIFTVTMTPQTTEGETNILHQDAKDVALGDSLKIDVYLTNTSASDVTINTYKLVVVVPEQLTYGSFTKSTAGKITETVLADGNIALDYMTNSLNPTGSLINLKAAGDANGGDTKKLGTINLTVSGTNIVYGNIITIALSSNSNFHISGEGGPREAIIVPAKVEVVTTYNITWNVDGTTTTQEVGIGIDPTSASAVPEYYPGNPSKPGYDFSGWTPTVVPAAADATYTATWALVDYNVTYAEGTSFGDATPQSTYTILSGISSVPVQESSEFLGWTAEQVGTGIYNWDTVDPPITNANTVGLYGNVKLTPAWRIISDVVFADYKYANGYAATVSNGKLLLVGVETVNSGHALCYNGDAMFTTTDANYLALLNAAYEAGTLSNGKSVTSYTTAYIFVVPADTTVEQALAALSIGSGANTAIARDGNVNYGTDGHGNQIDSSDSGIVDDLLYLHNTYDDMRFILEADVVTSDGNMQFGTIDDVIQIITLSNSGN